MALRNPVVSVLAQPRSFAVDVVAGTAFELLAALDALSSPDRGATWAPASLADCPPSTRAAVEAVADPSGGVWLNLLGLVLEQRRRDARSFIARVRELDPFTLRLHLLGRYAVSWLREVGPEVIERGAAGDSSAAKAILRASSRYCEDATPSFAAILTLDGAETTVRIVRALESFEREVLRPQQRALQAQLSAEAKAKRELAGTTDGYELIETASGGLRYEHDAAFDRVVLVPQLAGAPGILLAEHETTYLIAYPVAAERDFEAELCSIGRALGDPSRAAILNRLRSGEATLGDLAEAAGVGKSTAHHHLVQLRAARLVTIHGNAHGFRYSLDAAGLAAAHELLANLT